MKHVCGIELTSVSRRTKWSANYFYEASVVINSLEYKDNDVICIV